MTIEVTLNHILQAGERIKAHRTPVQTCSAISKLASVEDAPPVELFFKCELFQKTGCASNAVELLTDDEAVNGVVAHSSGNHAQAIALAAKIRGIPAYVVMPNTTAEIKKIAVRSYGANVIECESIQSAREHIAEQIRSEKGAFFIHPFSNANVIAGQGTIVLELLSQVSDLDAIIVPVGGGGMLTGCAIAAKGLKPDIKIFAAEPSSVDDCYRSFKSKQRLINAASESVADGLLTNLGDIAYSELHKHVDDVFTVTEKEIINAMELIWGRMKLCIEASAAVGVAVSLYNNDFRNLVKEQGIKRIGVILSGGNVDLLEATKLFEKYRH